jgi:tRNA (cytidine32/uridine32-2'-O)-methyltransferase
MKLSNIHIVLVRTFHPGNIGSAVRSAKTMAIQHVDLVSPKDYPHEHARQMAAGAADLLESCEIYTDLADCLADSKLTIATTARPRGYDLPVVNPEQAAKLLLEHSTHGKVALMFGPERMGLHNEDLKLAQFRLTVPANPEYSSLNLAAAVQIMSYEIFKAAQIADTTQPPSNCEQLPSSTQFEQLLNELEKVLKRVAFLRPHQGETLLRIRQYLRRTQPSQLEMNIMRGAVKAIARELNAGSK